MKTAAALLVVVTALAVVGCQKKTDKTAPAANGAVTDITPTAPTYTPTAPAYTPAPTPAYTAPTPVVSETPAVTTTPTPVAASGNYTVKKGDTLYSIARTHYNDGKQWTKIVEANPGLDPAKLKVGQTIRIP